MEISYRLVLPTPAPMPRLRVFLRSHVFLSLFGAALIVLLPAVGVYTPIRGADDAAQVGRADHQRSGAGERRGGPVLLGRSRLRVAE